MYSPMLILQGLINNINFTIFLHDFKNMGSENFQENNYYWFWKLEDRIISAKK